MNLSPKEGLKAPPPSKLVVEKVRNTKDESNGGVYNEVKKGLVVNCFNFASCRTYRCPKFRVLIANVPLAAITHLFVRG